MAMLALRVNGQTINLFHISKTPATKRLFNELAQKDMSLVVTGAGSAKNRALVDFVDGTVDELLERLRLATANPKLIPEQWMEIAVKNTALHTRYPAVMGLI